MASEFSVSKFVDVLDMDFNAESENRREGIYEKKFNSTSILIDVVPKLGKNKGKQFIKVSYHFLIA